MNQELLILDFDKVQKEYKFQEFQKLLSIEKSKAYKDFGNACLKETGASNTFYSDLRSQATALAKQGNYGNAIDNFFSFISYSRLERHKLLPRNYVSIRKN